MHIVFLSSVTYNYFIILEDIWMMPYSQFLDDFLSALAAMWVFLANEIDYFCLTIHRFP